MKAHGLYGMVREPLAVKVGQGAPRGDAARALLVGKRLPALGRHLPRFARYIEETFGDLDADLRHRILVGNAAEHLRLDLDADITETPAAA